MKNITFITNNASIICENFCQKIRSSHNVAPAFGAELEFYITNKIQGSTSELQNFLNIAQKQLNLKIEKEKGSTQFEVNFEPTFDFELLSNQINSFKKNIVALAKDFDLSISFDAKPFKKDFGNALQIHVSLHDENSITPKSNIFNLSEINDNHLLVHSINGILDLTSEGMALFCNEEDFLRLNHCNTAPSNLSWGSNNRTTAIRIPKNNNRTVEFRIPSANSDPSIIMMFLSASIYYGISHKLNHHERIFGNAFHQQYTLQKLPIDLKKCIEIFQQKNTLNTLLKSNITEP